MFRQKSIRASDSLVRQIYTVVSFFVILIPNVVFFFLIFNVKAFLYDNRYDDCFFYQLAIKYDFFDYIIMRYKTWSGRLVGDSLSYFLSLSGIWLYRCLSVCSYLLTIYSICKIATGNINKKAWFLS